MVRLLLLSFLFTSYVSCVGTLEESLPQATRTTEGGVGEVYFDGIYDAVAISDTRIEVFFISATGGSGNFTYLIYIGSSPFPISVPGDLMLPDYRGLMKYTATGLSRSSNYLIRVEVIDNDTGALSDSLSSVNVQTFGNEVADFNGISSVSNMPGEDGKDAIRVRWTHAKTSPGLATEDWEPSVYEVTFVDASKLTPNDMHNTNFGTADGRFVYQVNFDESINEYVARGLTADTRFYVRVRALHEASIDDIFNPNLRGERNTNYREISTLSDDLAALNFDPSTFSLANRPGEEGLTAVTATWSQVTGVFDHFRLYYGKSSESVQSGAPATCLSPSQASGGIYCKKLGFTEVSTIVSGLDPRQEYKFVLFVCQSPTCLSGQRVESDEELISTIPALASFAGIASVSKPKSLDTINEAYLNLNEIDFDTGYFDGLIIKMGRTLDQSDLPVTIERDSGTVRFLDFDHTSVNKITVTGVDYLSDQPYCFSVHPFTYNDETATTFTEYPNNIYECALPGIDGPAINQFPGVGNALADGDLNLIQVTWSEPTGGIYSHYEVFWKKLDTNFNFLNAIQETTVDYDFSNYGRALVEDDELSYDITNLADGNYAIGVLTWYAYIADNGAQEVRSEQNTNIIFCTIQDGVTQNCSF